jgi:hypothetical protein
MNNKESIKSLYPINLIEGEGVGTSYEYYAKLRKLKKFVRSIGRPKRILIAGLPEKYGLSMDFFLLGQMLQAETVAIDERPDVLQRVRTALLTIKYRDLFNDTNIVLMRADSIADFNNDNGLFKEKFDLALSSEVLQRLDGAQETYISSLKKAAKNFAVFAPNRGNESHATLSGLKGIYLEELLKHCSGGSSDETIYDYGYIDMPPFPPGVTRSQEKREQAAESRLESSLMKGLEIYSLCENLIPKFIKKKIAHIVYIMVKSQ